MKSLISWKPKTNVSVSPWADNWFNRVLENPFKDLTSLFTKNFPRLPSVDVLEGKDEITVKVEVPGMTEKDIDLTWHDGVLRIRGEKKDEKEQKIKDRYYHECCYGIFSRDIRLNGTVDWKKAEAKYKHGVLTVKLPKTEGYKKSIQIQVN
jgi:HSP20 family protein